MGRRWRFGRGRIGTEGFGIGVLADGAGMGQAGTSTLGSGAVGMGIATLDSGTGLRGLVAGGVVARFKI